MNNPKLLLSIQIAALLILIAACTPKSDPSTLPEFDNVEPSESAIAMEATSIQQPTEVTQTADIQVSTSTPEPTQRPVPNIPDGDFRSWILVADGFRQPLNVTNAGDGSNRLFVVGQQGRIWVIADGQVLAEPFFDIRGRVNSLGNEQGLLGLAFHPNFEENGYFFINYTDSSPATIISRFSISDDPNRADVSSENILLSISQPYSNHNGGHVEFGPDGYLYIGMGDGGSAADPRGNGQNTDTLLGTLLRIDVDSAQPYAIPPDNPFTNGGGRPEIWAIGLRNPWRFSFDAETGDLYIGDVGQNIWEEIDYLPGGIVGGVNFGWNYFEGQHSFAGDPPSNLSFFPPVAEYDHADFRCSVTGGVVYRGQLLPELWGVYFYGDYCSGEIFALVQDVDGRWKSEVVYNLPLLITSFGTDENGEIYVLDRNGGLYNLR